MAKRWRKLGMRREEDPGGCVWNFVSKLHSRGRGSTRKLLLDNKSCMETAPGYGISRTNPDLMTGEEEVNGQDGERTELMAMDCKPSVKTLMEEEMFIEADAEWINSLKQGKRCCDLVTDDDHASSCCRADEQGLTDDAKDIVEYLGDLFQQGSGIWEEDGGHGEEEFSRALRRAVSQQLVKGRQLSEDEVLCCSKVLTSMLLILNSTEFSLLELLRDPEAMLTKCMEILRETELGRSSSKRSTANSISLRKEEGDRFEVNVGSPLVPNRIVILKPWTTELPKRAKSLKPGTSRGTESIGTKGQKKSGAPGFLSDIKRKLRNIVAKEYADESNDSISRKSRKGHGGRRSSEKKPSGKGSKDESAPVSVRTNKYLSEAITVDDEDTSSSSREPETVGMILLNPELNSSIRMSPGRRWEYGAATGSSSRTKSRIVSDKRRKPELTPVVETETYAFKFLAENIPPSAANGDGTGIKVVQDTTEESSLSIASSSDGLLILDKGGEDLEIAIDLPERPSPVSVLEQQHFSDDDISPAIYERGMPARDFCLSAGFRRQQLEVDPEDDDQIHVDEADARVGTFEWDSGLVLDRVAALIQTPDSTWEELYLKSQSSDQLLQPSLHDQLLFQQNAKLLIDCVNEVLLEACARFVGCSCLSLAGQRMKPIQSTDFIAYEVCREVKRHLDPIPHPRSLEQIIGKDMSRTGQWMDLTFEGESIGFELGDAIFSELLDEITKPVGIC